MFTVSVMLSSSSGSSGSILGFVSGEFWGMGGVTVSISCGVQVAGENVNIEDSEEISVWLSCDSSEISTGVLLLV